MPFGRFIIYRICQKSNTALPGRHAAVRNENAACHLALGMGFTNTIRGFENKTLKECREMGINDSMEHNDFMIGYEGLDIDAVTKDGKSVPIFRRGRWAFDV